MKYNPPDRDKEKKSPGCDEQTVCVQVSEVEYVERN